jgi:hypothetical protein
MEYGLSSFDIFNPPTFEDIRKAGHVQRNHVVLSGVPTKAIGSDSWPEDAYSFFIWPDSLLSPAPSPVTVLLHGDDATTARRSIESAKFVHVEGRLEGREAVSIIVASSVKFL